MLAKLYKNIFEPIARKLWGNPKTLDLKLSQGRVQIPSFLEIILNVLNIRRKSNFEALNFWYPKGGLQSLWDAILAKAGEQCKLIIDHKVIELKSNGSVIESIVCSTEGGVKEIKISEKDFVLSTLPITHY